MALTKVRLPVADIQSVSNGNSNVGISTAGGDAVVTVGGSTKATFGSSANTLSQPTTVTNLDGVENIDLTVAAGATGVLEAIAASLRLWTTSAHTLVLGANNTTGLTIRTDGRVALAVDGTAADDLVDKGYVDAIGAAAAAAIDTNAAVTGHIRIPTSSDDIIINWGRTGNLTPGVSITATFDEPFDNAFLHGQITTWYNTPDTSFTRRPYIYGTPTTTEMLISHNGLSNSQMFWMAIGY